MHIVGLSPKKVLRDYPSAYLLETEGLVLQQHVKWFIKIRKIWVIAARGNMYVSQLKDSTKPPQMIVGSFSHRSLTLESQREKKELTPGKFPLTSAYTL